MIYTFYSYKGGVGRTMALANIAELFYQAGLKVLVVDWDLEAPGLERFFPSINLEETLDQPGLIDMLLRYKEQMAQEIDDETPLEFESPGQYIINVYPEQPGPGELFLLTAGRRSRSHFADYARAVLTFDWQGFYITWGGELYFNWLREEFESMADVTLIDSRTGVTEMGGVCTYQLADVVLMFCTPNQQSIGGTYEMARDFTNPKVRELRRGRSLEVLIIPARVEDRAETHLLNEFHRQFIARFDDFLPKSLKGELGSFWKLKIPQVPYYSFDEVVAVREKVEVQSEDMVKAFDLLSKMMVKLTQPEIGVEFLSSDPAEFLPDMEKVVNVYLSTEAWDKLASLFETERRNLYNYNTAWAKILDNWLSQIPEGDLVQYPLLLLLRGLELNDLGQLELAADFFRQAEKQFLELNDLVGAAEAKVCRSVSLRMIGERVQEAVELASQGLDQLEANRASKWIIAWSIRNRSIAHGIAGNIEEALEDLERALEMFEALDDTYRAGLCHHDIGRFLGEQGNVEGAKQHTKEAICIWQTIGNTKYLALALNNMGMISCITGNYGEAIERCSRAFNLAIQIGATRQAAFAQASLGDAYLGCQEYDQAIEAYTVSTELAGKATARRLEVYNTVKTGECYYQQHNMAQALKLANQAREIASEVELPFETGLVYLLQARVHIRIGYYSTSSELLAKAVDCFTENPLEQAQAQLWWAYSLLLDLRASAAHDHLQEAIRLALTLGEPIQGIEQAILETQRLLFHFLYRVDIPKRIRKSIRTLITQSQELDEASKPILQVFAFGTPLLSIAGNQKRFDERAELLRVPELLLYLILKGQDSGCRQNEIMGAIWPELEPKRAQDILHESLQTLQEFVLESPDHIILKDDYYQVNSQYLDWCDALVFEVLGDRAARAGQDEALALYLEVIELYKGEFLAGFILGDWGNSHRARCEVKLFQSIRLASEQLLKDGLCRKALEVIKKGLAQDYSREDLHRNALRVYADLGSYDDLQSHYVDLCKWLQQKYARSPDPVTEQLYEQLTARR